MFHDLKVALVHDYLKEYGGAERVLTALTDIFPQAPIYTAFVTPGSTAAQAFSHKTIIPWKHQWLINRHNFHSPLRFLIPLIWESFDFSAYDLVISSASGYITKGIITPPDTQHICYCHTPPRWLYGYPTSVNWQKWLPVRIYGQLLKHQLLQYDYWAARRVDTFIANSHNVARRIKKFYRRNAQVIYPPVNVKQIAKTTTNLQPQDYYLVVSRLVGAKGWQLLFDALDQFPVPVKIVGEPAGFSPRHLDRLRRLQFTGRRSGKILSISSFRPHEMDGEIYINQIASAAQPLNNRIQFLGRVSDQQLWQLYGRCRALLALARDEDFGITPVEAMAAGRPVIAYAGGGYLETVIESQTGTFFHHYSAQSLVQALKTFRPESYSPATCRRQARKFSRERFTRQIKQVISQELK
jgi:glycosyltransferase involved in cell wall biosynthesis